jgi:RimJ/RimL family protein N-acetyltransferase
MADARDSGALKETSMPSRLRLIRELGVTDADAFRDIRLEALRLHPDAFGSSYTAEAAESLRRFRDRVARGGRFGGFVDDQLVGVVGFSRYDEARLRHKGMLVGMYVRESQRGTGLADEIVNAVVDYARQHVELLHLSVATTNLRAVRFYERMGFNTYATEPKALKVDINYIDEFLMVRFL